MAVKRKNEYVELIKAFNEATALSISMAIIPVAFLVIGVALDEALNTKPLFIFAGIVVGAVFGVFRAYSIAIEKKGDKK